MNTTLAAGRRPVHLFWVLAALVFGGLSFGVQAQMGHSHQWAAEDNLPAIGLSTETGTGITGQTVALVLPTSLYDTDVCLSQNWEDPCSFYYNEASNNVVPTSWSDGGAGGRFGYLDNYGQFTVATEPYMVSHYECPPAIGSVTLSVTYDDQPRAWEPGTGNPVITYDDAPVTANCTLTVELPPVHQHAWDLTDNIPLPTLEASVMEELEPGDVVDLQVQISPDVDTCVNYYDCTFSFAGPENQVVPLGWSDGSAGGEFGYKQNGQFVPATDPGQVTHYRCAPVLEGSRQIELVLTVDDVPSATDPATGESLTTHDDAPVSARTSLVVYAPHQHAWEAENNLPNPSFQVTPTPALTGSVVQLEQ